MGNFLNSDPFWGSFFRVPYDSGAYKGEPSLESDPHSRHRVSSSPGFGASRFRDYSPAQTTLTKAYRAYRVQGSGFLGSRV